MTGVESSFQAATRARQVLDSVVCRKIGDVPVSQFRPNSFDCIVLADVLEHLRDPLATLKKCALVVVHGHACCQCSEWP